MSLCTTCASIDFARFPLNNLSQHITHHNFDEMTFHSCSALTSENGTVRPLSTDAIIAFHESLTAIEHSAPSCALCALILKAVLENWPMWEAQRRSWDPPVEKTDIALRIMRRRDIRVPINGGVYTKHKDSGFYIVSGIECKDCQPQYCYFVWTNLRFFATGQDSPLGPHLKQPFLSSSPSTTAIIDQCREWIHDCVSKHETDTCSQQSKPKLPRRIIDLADPELIRLRETKDEFDDYVALSYCWGSDGATRLDSNAETVEIPTVDLPQTFRDAIRLTVELGLRYLWIDRLCIIQGDNEDWREEAPKMCDYYGGAYFTIAADLGEDSHSGLFHPSKRRQAEPLTVLCNGERLKVHGRAVPGFDLPRAENHRKGVFDGEPLSKRAWALQERYLARRTLHFTSSGIFCECKEFIVSDDGAYSRGSYKLFGSKHLRPKLIKENFWPNLIEEYSARKLTMPSDKLPAISGLARLFCEKYSIPGPYLAGIWWGMETKALCQQLCWEKICREPPSVTEANYSRSPYWSWTAVDNRVYFRKSDVSLFQPVDYELHLAGSDPYGEVENCSIRIRGLLYRVEKCSTRGSHWVSNLSLLDRATGVAYSWMKSAEEDHIYIRWDSNDRDFTRAEELTREGVLFMLPLAYGARGRDKWFTLLLEDVTSGVEAVKGGQRTLRRIGSCTRMPQGLEAGILERHSQGVLQTVTLV